MPQKQFNRFNPLRVRNHLFSGDGQEGRMALELANAIILSSHTGEKVNLPLNREAYRNVLENLQNGTKI